MRDREKTERKKETDLETDTKKQEICTEKELKHTLYFSFRERERQKDKEKEKGIYILLKR